MATPSYLHHLHPNTLSFHFISCFLLKVTANFIPVLVSGVNHMFTFWVRPTRVSQVGTRNTGEMSFR